MTVWWGVGGVGQADPQAGARHTPPSGGEPGPGPARMGKAPQSKREPRDRCGAGFGDALAAEPVGIANGRGDGLSAATPRLGPGGHRGARETAGLARAVLLSRGGANSPRRACRGSYAVCHPESPFMPPRGNQRPLAAMGAIGRDGLRADRQALLEGHLPACHAERASSRCRFRLGVRRWHRRHDRQRATATVPAAPSSPER